MSTVCDIDATALKEAGSESEKSGSASETAGSANKKALSDRGVLHCVQADVSRYEDVQSFFAQIEVEQGRLDVLVNNAGVSGPTALAEAVDPADWDQTIAVNLTGQFYCAREAIPLLKAAGGGSNREFVVERGLFRTAVALTLYRQ